MKTSKQLFELNKETNPPLLTAHLKTPIYLFERLIKYLLKKYIANTSVKMHI